MQIKYIYLHHINYASGFRIFLLYNEYADPEAFFFINWHDYYTLSKKEIRNPSSRNSNQSSCFN